MSFATYGLSVQPAFLSHGLGNAPPLAWLGDYDLPQGASEPINREFTITDAMAASGDYFITLATHLDKLAQGLAQDSAEQIELEHIVQTLFYLQEHWNLVAKYKQHK